MSRDVMAKVAKVFGVTLPKPPVKPDLGLEAAGALAGLPPADLGVARRAFNVRDYGLVDAEILGSHQALLANLRKIRGEIARARTTVDRLHTPLAALYACAGQAPPSTLQAPPPPTTAAALQAERTRRENVMAGGHTYAVQASGPAVQAVIDAAAAAAAEAARKAAALGGVAASEPARAAADLQVRTRLVQYNNLRVDADTKALFFRQSVAPWQARLAALEAAVQLEDRIMALTVAITKFEAAATLLPSQQAALTAHRQELPMRVEQRQALAIPAAPR